MMFFVVITVSVVTLVSSQTGLCPAPNGDFANPSSELCTTFFRCIQGNPTLLRCPANQRFDFLFRICRQQVLVDCNSQLELFAAPAIVPGLGGLRVGGTLAETTGLGGLAGLAGTGVGTGLQNQDLIGLLSQLDGDGQNGNDGLATLLMVSALMNQRKSSQPPITGPVPVSQLYGQVPGGPVTIPLDQARPQAFGASNVGFGQGTAAATPNGQTILVVPQYVQNQDDNGAWGNAALLHGQQGQLQGQGNGAGAGGVSSGQLLAQGQDQTLIQNTLQGPSSNVGQGQTIHDHVDNAKQSQGFAGQASQQNLRNLSRKFRANGVIQGTN